VGAVLTRGAFRIVGGAINRKTFFVLLLCLLSWPVVTYAVQPDEMLSDPQLEARARTLSRQLRCMVCQNQSIDDSDAPLARDLRILVRERLQAGDSDTQVLNFLVARYGEFVLLRPRFNAHTALLWLMPVIVLLIGGAALVFAWRRYRRQSASGSAAADSSALSPAEADRLSRILQGGDS
jgi:cytochrome c-type biogenesis protein CcmH